MGALFFRRAVPQDVSRASARRFKLSGHVTTWVAPRGAARWRPQMSADQMTVDATLGAQVNRHVASSPWSQRFPRKPPDLGSDELVIPGKQVDFCPPARDTARVEQ